MIVKRHKSALYVTLYPGEYYATDKRAVISTILGSCVSACLYDPVMNIVGMNHFLLSNRRYSKNMPVCMSEAGRYGIHAMELVINKMLRLGAQRRNLLAKAFGGGSILNNSQDNYFCVGEVNSRFVREFLENDDIPLVSSDLGGETGRTISFMSYDYSVHVRKIKKIQSSVLQKERQYWQRSIEEDKEKTPEIELWQ